MDQNEPFRLVKR